MKEKYERYGERLDTIIEHLREDRKRDAPEVINDIPDEEIRDFAFFLALHVERDLDVLRSEVRERTKAEMRLGEINPN